MKERNYYICKISLFFVFLNFSVLSQNTVIKHYGVNQGLPSSETYFITQDSKGYIWIATDAGVVKYDGYKFKTYNSSNGLPDNTVFKIHEDKYGKIWFATYSGQMAWYSHKTDSIYCIKGNEQLTRLIKIVPADFAFDDKDTLFISTSRHGYIKLAPPNYDSIQAYDYAGNFYFLKKVTNESFIYGNKFNFKIGNGGKIPFIFQGGLNSYKLDSGLKIPCIISYVSAVKSGLSSYLFSDSRSIYKISENKKEILYRAPESIEKGIITIYKDSFGRVWLNTHSKGAFLFQSENFSGLPRRFLDGQSVSSVFEDSDHGIWLTTLENGIYYIPTLDFMFLNKENGLLNDKIFSINIKNDVISCLTSDGCINMLDIHTKTITDRFMALLSPVSLFSFNNKLLICSTSSIIIDTDTKEITKIYTWEGDKIISDGLRLKKAIHYSEDYMLGCYDGNVVKISKKNYRTSMLISGLPTIFSMHLCNDVLWMGTKTGLYSYHNRTLTFHGADIDILKNRVEDMAHIGNKLFLATRGFGVLCLENNKITQQYTEAVGLASNMCKTIIADSSGNLWVGTNRGISRFKKNGTEFYSINTIDLSNGLVSNEINQIINYKDKIYFATNNGLGIINVKDAFNPAISIPVYIENFTVNNEKKDFIKKYIFRHDENFIKINYKGIYVKAESDINYKYRLEGLDTNWTYSKNTFVQYTTLPPGTYKFVVYALNSEGKHSVAPAIIEFKINSPFWKTLWFYLGLLILICILIYVLLKQRIKFITKQEEEKTRINKLISESELKALRAQMNPHFMFNAINSIQNFVLKNDSRSAQKYLTKFARLIRSVLENSKHELVWLRKEVEALELYIELETLRASFSFDYEVIMDDSLNADNLFIPPMIIQPYIENAILHGIIPLSDRRGKLTVKFSHERSVLKCVIDDNGIGRIKAEEIKLRKQLSHESMGMSVTEDRINILNKHNQNVLMQVVVLDKIVDEIPMGTTVEITISLKNSSND